MSDEHPIVAKVREQLSWSPEHGEDLVAFYDKLSPLDPLKSPINDRGVMEYDAMVGLLVSWVCDDFMGLRETKDRQRYGKGRPPWRKK